MDITQKLVYPFEGSNRQKCLLMTVGENSIVPFHDLSTEICFDQYTLDSLSHHNHGSISILDAGSVSALGFADISSKNVLCGRTIHTFWRLYDRSTGRHPTKLASNS
ncbi:AVN_collapsed_G0046550.mRNA.1.CDS.1 [Saccharomyces cerevisiae]|nr:AVN_collapsed_G0046550.mRNA.1.CDS.1 [Saccharomyces cerevisiae]